MKSYLNAKLILFREILNRNSTVITDKEIKPFNVIKQIARKKNFKLHDITKRKIKKIDLENNNFKTKNLLMAISAVKLCGLKKKYILRSLNQLREVNGRLELVKRFPNNIKIFIDYAHTPDALYKTLRFLIYRYGNNISLVFGCGGERDKKKRPLMARIANENCKKVYITDDNPRNENPKKIRDLLSKFIAKNKIYNIGSRSLAINRAIQNADPNEIILIAGKGHEEQQIYKNKIFDISDKKIIKKIKIKNISKIKRNYKNNNFLLEKIIGKIKPINFNGLSIDSRLIKKDNLFVALKGKKNDGNKFIFDALKKGAGCIVTSSKLRKSNKKIIKVKNSFSFLNHFAKLKRDYSSSKIIAITGSAGKTSLKELIKDLLQDFAKTYSSPKSYNNYLGVPLVYQT